MSTQLREPTQYWEERLLEAECALNQLRILLAHANPLLADELAGLYEAHWQRVEALEGKYPEPAPELEEME